MRATYLWILQLVTGALIAVLLGTHIVLMHLDAVLGFFGADAADVTSWTSMISRAGNSLFAALYIALLAVGLYHGINGLRGILLETSPSPRTERAINWLSLVLGVAIFAGATCVPVALLIS